MIVIKKYPNRRLYNTSTSSYINLDGILALIRDDLTVQIIDSKSQRDVTTETLLSMAVNSELLELLVPGALVQQLIRTDKETEKRLLIENLNVVFDEEDSETQEDKTIPRVELLPPEESESEELSEESSSESDSEVTKVRVGVPPTISAVTDSDMVEGSLGEDTPKMGFVPKTFWDEEISEEDSNSLTIPPIEELEVESVPTTIPDQENELVVEDSVAKPLSKSEELKARLEAMRTKFKR